MAHFTGETGTIYEVDMLCIGENVFPAAYYRDPDNGAITIRTQVESPEGLRNASILLHQDHADYAAASAAEAEANREAELSRYAENGAQIVRHTDADCISVLNSHGKRTLLKVFDGTAAKPVMFESYPRRRAPKKRCKGVCATTRHAKPSKQQPRVSCPA